MGEGPLFLIVQVLKVVTAIGKISEAMVVLIVRQVHQLSSTPSPQG